jgi:ribosomal protein S7
MSRRHRAERRELLPDPKFGSLTVSRFMNSVMKQGKKSVAETIVYGALDQIEGKVKQSPVSVFETALENVAPADATATPEHAARPAGSAKNAQHGRHPAGPQRHPHPLAAAGRPAHRRQCLACR